MNLGTVEQDTSSFTVEVHIMGLDDRAKAAAKNVEGKAQEALGKVTGDKEDQAAGKAKQAEASVRHAGEDVKDGVKDAIN
jgi:uncharacterized protein YjbJ (UPF0337 family)